MCVLQVCFLILLGSICVFVFCALLFINNATSLLYNHSRIRKVPWFVNRDKNKELQTHTKTDINHLVSKVFL